MYKRKLSFNERFFLVTDRITSPFCNQMIYEGSGEFDLPRWEKALEEASAANPGTRVVLKGLLSCARWVDSGKTPRLRVVDGSSWSGMGDEGAPFLQEHLDPFKGPSCEVVLIKGRTLRVAFRTHHAVMDGRGTIFWAEEIFRCLRGETPAGSDSTLADYELAWMYQKKGRTPPPHEFIAPTGKAAGNASGVTWQRRRLQGKFRNFLGQVSVLVGREARASGNGKVRLTIPVDLRQRSEGLLSTGNLTNTIYILVTPESTADSVAQDVALQLENFGDCMIYHREKIMSHVPLWFMTRELKKIIREKHAAGMYHNSGIISNLGRFDLEKFSGGGFSASSWFAVPPCQEIVPFFMVLAGSGGWVDLMIGMPRVLASGGRLGAFMEHVIAGLEAE
ncbi:MAG TPA: hypothetical protein PK926_01210 [Spirochaetota bacterium]|nr:hypothetical protein [Spirochaetota bacterium]HPI88647.1 hypothetical protein [Spirochaetota bacterium]HPR49587.1 hypothetical protein [Spirochaetota bacterium]